MIDQHSYPNKIYSSLLVLQGSNDSPQIHCTGIALHLLKLALD